jgi:hypothetical protein
MEKLFLLSSILLLAGCHKSSNNNPNSSFINATNTMHVQMEKKYVLQGGGDTIIFHSNQTVTESTPTTIVTFAIQSSTENYFSPSLIQGGTALKLWAVNPIDASSPYIYSVFYRAVSDTSTLSEYISGSNVVNNQPTLTFTWGLSIYDLTSL